jgi:hypothetical protein
MGPIEDGLSTERRRHPFLFLLYSHSIVSWSCGDRLKTGFCKIEPKYRYNTVRYRLRPYGPGLRVHRYGVGRPPRNPAASVRWFCGPRARPPRRPLPRSAPPSLRCCSSAPMASGSTRPAMSASPQPGARRRPRRRGRAVPRRCLPVLKAAGVRAHLKAVVRDPGRHRQTEKGRLEPVGDGAPHIKESGPAQIFPPGSGPHGLQSCRPICVLLPGIG